MIWKLIIGAVCVCALYLMWTVLKQHEQERVDTDAQEAERREWARQRVNDEIEAKRRSAVRRAYLHD